MNKIFDNKQEFTELYRDAVMSISGKSVEAASEASISSPVYSIAGA